MEYDIPGEHRWEDPPQRIGEPDWGIHTSGALSLIDTRRGSRKGRYVNSLMLELPAPAGLRISPPMTSGSHRSTPSTRPGRGFHPGFGLNCDCSGTVVYLLLSPDGPPVAGNIVVVTNPGLTGTETSGGIARLKVTGKLMTPRSVLA